MDAPYAIAETLEPGVARLLARNPSPFTYFGTQTYLVGEEELVVIDPGPDVPEHVEAILAAIEGRPLAAIACTHTHRDHSPASRALKQATGAPIIGCAPLVLESIGPRADASFDKEYSPDRMLADGEAIEFDGGKRLVAVATPGPHQQPSLFRVRRCAVHRRPCHGLVNHGGGAPGRRHGRLYAKPRRASAARRPHLLSGAWTGGDQSCPARPRHDRPSTAAGAANSAAGRRTAA